MGGAVGGSAGGDVDRGRLSRTSSGEGEAMGVSSPSPKMSSCLSIHIWMRMLTEGTSLWSWRGSRESGARVRVGPKTKAKLGDPILLSVACKVTR